MNSKVLVNFQSGAGQSQGGCFSYTLPSLSNNNSTVELSHEYAISIEIVDVAHDFKSIQKIFRNKYK